MTTSNTTTNTIAIPFDDFVRYNASMLKLLYTLQQSGGSLPTNALYTRAHKSNNYSRPWLLKAERMGFITRKRVPMPEGQRGYIKIINTLTPKGASLLKRLREYKPRL